jgi:spore coat protein A
MEKFMISRRDFLKLGAASITGLWFLANSVQKLAVKAFSTSNALAKFVQPLRGVYPLDPNGIPVAVPDGKRLWKGDDIKAQHYTIDVNQYTDTLHPELGPTTMRGYHSRTNLGGTVPQRHLGGIIIAQKGTPVQITFQNNLTGSHPLMVDTTVMGAELGENRISTHLHGGEVPWISDGGPFAWSDSTGGYGTSAQSGAMNIYKAINKNLLPGQSEVYYPNNQSARMMWYHDHAVGITRLNAYAGIASAYILRDKFEASLKALGLPEFIEKGGREIPLVLQDKIFVDAEIAVKDPTWAGVSTPGSLWYPHEYDLWDSAPPLTTPFTPPASSVVPEMFGDTMLVNGVVHPFAALEPARYRLRILNACQARFFNLQLYVDNGSGMPDFTQPGPNFLVIGTEGGFLANPVDVASNRPMNFLPPPDDTTVDLANPGGSLLTAPGERWDVIVDFAGFAGKSFILYTDAPAPFPGGDPTFDQNEAAGLNTRNIMRFDIGPTVTGPADVPMAITPALPLAANKASGIDPFLVPFGASIVNGAVKLPKRATVRQLTLNEVFDEHGRLAQLLGTNVPAPLPMNYYIDPMNPDNGTNYARAYDDVATETPLAGATEVWQIANLTMDTHPIHFHLVNAQILARQSFTDANGNMLYTNGVPTYTAPAVGPDATELGWKETIKMNPGEVTTVIMKFKLPKVPFKVPASPRTGGNEYVWHCHILDHEEHDMMRPLIVK